MFRLLGIIAGFLVGSEIEKRIEKEKNVLTLGTKNEISNINAKPDTPDTPDENKPIEEELKK